MRLAYSLCFATLVATAGCNSGNSSNSNPSTGNGNAGGSSNTSTTNPSSSGGTGGTAGTRGTSSGSSGNGGSGGGTGGNTSAPHAIGAIALGETHPAAGGTATPYLSASFQPNTNSAGAGAGAGANCSQSIGPCRVTLLPDCAQDCNSDEYCTFDEDCNGVCQRICGLTCAADERCVFESDEPVCRLREDFDAGLLQFSGTTVPVTLSPPYMYDGQTSGSLFSGGAQLTVTATGASGAGFAAFEQSFLATQLLQTSPRLDLLERQAAFGDQDIPIGWVPGDDQIRITATLIDTQFNSVTLVCEGDDSSGSFTLPRTALLQALDNRPLSSLSLSVTRSRSETFEGFDTVGELMHQVVESEGWLALSTSSTESHTFEGCSGGQAVCGDTCVDLEEDFLNCGSCGNACDVSDYGCIDGNCEPCALGLAECSNGCRDLLTDKQNCGSCGNVCAASDHSCRNGKCEPCAPDFALCGAVCEDILNDNTHCGGCNQPCAAGTECFYGGCYECNDGSCSTCGNNQLYCDGSCVTVSANRDYCGDCETVCDDYERCDNGTCKDCGSLARCGNSCAELATDNNHCGTCNNPCNNDICVAGNCVPRDSCTEQGLTNCGGSCVNLSSNVDHCGECDFYCYFDEVCFNGECFAN